MAHPRLYHDDLGLAELRAFCLSLPGATEHEMGLLDSYRTTAPRKLVAQLDEGLV